MPLLKMAVLLFLLVSAQMRFALATGSARIGCTGWSKSSAAGLISTSVVSWRG
ncbi:MAG: hypothetical protein IPI44_23385 [Sulfuritalea sp.]|nr:hypothetical protein [Sulfuritalea sp.]